MWPFVRFELCLGAGEQPVTSIQPELWVDRGSAAVAFYESAFGARSCTASARTTTSSPNSPSATRRSGIATAGSSTERLVPRAIGGATGRVPLVVDDPDAVVARAVAAGARSKSPVGEEHGWRVGRL